MRATVTRPLHAVGRRLRVRRAVALALRREPIRSEHVSLGLRRDLQVPFTSPAAKIPLRVRPLEPRDLPLLDPPTPGALSEEELGDRRNRAVLATAGVGHGFVAVDEDDRPCYVQWLLGPDDLERVRWHFGGLVPRLAAGEMLLEGAYTVERSRGQGVMAHAMATIAERATPLGARWVLTFTGQSNVASIKGCGRAGFSPYLRRRERWSGLRRSVSSLPLEEPSA